MIVQFNDVRQIVARVDPLECQIEWIGTVNGNQCSKCWWYCLFKANEWDDWLMLNVYRCGDIIWKKNNTFDKCHWPKICCVGQISAFWLFLNCDHKQFGLFVLCITVSVLRDDWLTCALYMLENCACAFSWNLWLDDTPDSLFQRCVWLQKNYTMNEKKRFISCCSLLWFKMNVCHAVVSNHLWLISLLYSML